MKRIIKQSACKVITTAACAILIAAGVLGFNSISAKAANRAYTVDLSNGKSVTIDLSAKSGKISRNGTVEYTKEYKDAQMLSSTMMIYGPDLDCLYSSNVVLSQNPYQAISNTSKGLKRTLSAGNGATGYGKYIVSKDSFADRIMKANALPESMRPFAESSAKEYIQECELVIDGREGNGDSVFEVTIVYSGLPIVTTNKVNAAPTAAFIVGAQLESNGIRYRINHASGKLSALNLTKSVKNVNIPDYVNYGGYNLGVTDIAENFMMGDKKAKNVTIGSNVATIGKQAFYKCQKLKKVKINSSRIKSFGKKAFGKDAKGFYVKSPKKCVKSYRNKFTKVGLKSIAIK
ncbi:leucine-rich repeat protein [Butyrivibrio sp. JL13D10]|uniref:leucine-rich repeat protein n=1 Tax=Butyrivibrio sp. JL13D10 TaxID=3236815 RepID=UPI0038B4CFD0